MTATTAGHVTVSHRPTRVSGLAAVLAALFAAVSVLPETVTPALVGVGAGVAVAVVGDALRANGRSVVGRIVLAGGVAGAVVAVGYGGSLLSRPENVARMVVAGAGVLCVAAGVVPFRGEGSRRLLRAGTGLLFLTVLAAGLLQVVAVEPLLMSTAALFVGFDLGDNAVGLGEQLGRGAETLSVELSHGAVSLGVGAVAVGAGLVVPSIGTGGLSLSGLLLLLVALVGLSLALHD